jgi:hypothetical protein
MPTLLVRHGSPGTVAGTWLLLQIAGIAAQHCKAAENG